MCLEGRKLRLLLDIETRIFNVIHMALSSRSLGPQIDEDDREFLVRLLIATYQAGYDDALSEGAQGKRAKLYTDNEYGTPKDPKRERKG